MRSEKIQECQQKLQETWSLAREEAAKCKAAKEVIKALSSRVISAYWCWFSWLIAIFLNNQWDILQGFLTPMKVRFNYHKSEIMCIIGSFLFLFLYFDGVKALCMSDEV